MDKDVINRKLESLRRCIARITSKLPITRDELRSNYDLQDIIALNLERAVQICVDIAAHVLSQTEAPPPSTMAEGFASSPRSPAQYDGFFAGVGTAMVHPSLRVHQNGGKAVPDTPRPDDFDAVASGVERLDQRLGEPSLDL